MSLFGYSWLEPSFTPYSLRSRSRGSRTRTTRTRQRTTSDGDNLELSTSSNGSSPSSPPLWTPSVFDSFVQFCSCIPAVNKEDLDDEDFEEYSRPGIGIGSGTGTGTGTGANLRKNILNNKKTQNGIRNRNNSSGNGKIEEPGIRIEFPDDDDDEEEDEDEAVRIPLRLEDEDASLMSLKSSATSGRQEVNSLDGLSLTMSLNDNTSRSKQVKGHP